MMWMQRTYSYPLMGGVFIVIFLSLSQPAAAETVQCVNSYNGYQTRTYTLPANTLNPGPNQHNSLQTNAAAAQLDKGKTYFTLELTSFNDSQCVDGPCRNNIPGIAHRTWPINTCVAVCNVLNKACALAIVMDRGPNTQLRCRTIDANPALQAKLNMKGGTVPATYSLVAMPGEPCTFGNLQAPAIDPNMLNVQSVTSPISNAYGGNPYGNSGNLLSLLQPQQGMSVTTGQPAHASQGAYPSSAVPSTGTSGMTGETSSSVNAGSSSQNSGPGPAVATLLVQSDTVARGRTLTISWSSLGMSGIPQCRLGIAFPGGAEQVVKEENNGSEAVRVPISATTGQANVRLRCVSASGQAVEKTASVSVQ